MAEPIARCDDCGYALAFHVDKAGQFLGCPTRLASALGDEDHLPRITVRVGKAGARKGRVYVTWPDQMDADSGQIVVWEMCTGARVTDDAKALQRATRRAGRDHEQDVKEEIEYQIGGKVRVVAGNWGRNT